MSDLSPNILLVEDNEDDVFAMGRALKKAQVANPMQVATDGQKAVDYLSGVGIYANREKFPIPFIVFLDLKLPYVSGFEVLSWIRRQPYLQSIAVVVLTSSAENRDHERAYALGARTYLIKPPDPSELKEVLDSLGSLWLAKSAATPVSATTEAG